MHFSYATNIHLKKITIEMTNMILYNDSYNMFLIRYNLLSNNVSIYLILFNVYLLLAVYFSQTTYI
jgi:hypothetical protein